MTMSNSHKAPPAELAHRCGPLVHAIAPGQRIGGPGVASALLMLFGERLARELDARVDPSGATPTQRPRR